MKLIGRSNGKHCIASIAHYDYVFHDGMMADSGQPGTLQFGGYTRFGGEGKTVWFEVGQNFAELYNDYNLSARQKRKYGIWDSEKVKELPKEQWPDTNSLEYRAENAIWGTNGPDGTLPTTYVMMKDCSKEHLENILALLKTRFSTERTQELIKYWLDTEK